MGHILLNWGSYAHLNLQPVLYDQTTFILLIFFMFLTSISEMILSLWLSWLLLFVFGSSIYFISNTSTIISKRRRFPHPNWKRSKKWRRCKLHYWLVCSCRLRPKNRPCSLDGSFSPLPYCANHRNWIRGRERAKAFFNRLQMDGFLSGHKDGYYPW